MKRKKYYGPVEPRTPIPPMPSPAALLEAAKPGPPLNEKEIKAFLSKREPKFQAGFGGQNTLPADHHKKEGRHVFTPGDWRRVGIEESGDSFNLVQLISRVAITPTTLLSAQCDPGTKVRGLTLAQALETGKSIELAMQRLLRVRA